MYVEVYVACNIVYVEVCVACNIVYVEVYVACSIVYVEVYEACSIVYAEVYVACSIVYVKVYVACTRTSLKKRRIHRRDLKSNLKTLPSEPEASTKALSGVKATDVALSVLSLKSVTHCLVLLARRRM